MKKGLFLLLFLISTKIFAQNSAIEGIAFDKAAGAALEFASVSLYRSADSVLLNGQMADASGSLSSRNCRQELILSKFSLLDITP
jgi:ferric enterobactin receptor